MTPHPMKDFNPVSGSNNNVTFQTDDAVRQRREFKQRRSSVPMVELEMIPNWSNSYAVDGSKYRRPKTLDELKDIVMKAKKIRCAGSRHSCAPLIDSEEIIISLEHFDQILKIDTETKIVKFQGGVVIYKLAEVLAPHGLGLGTLGTIDWQTVVGAVMTGTHGGSLTTPSLHDFMESYTILKANGEIQKVSRVDDPEVFAAMAPSNGVFGIVIEAEMQCTPLETLAAKMTAVPFEGLEDQIQNIFQSSKYTRVIVYPSINQATVWTANVVEKGAAVADGASDNKDYTNYRDEQEKEWLEEFLVHNDAGLYDEAAGCMQKVLDSQLKRLAYYEGQHHHVLCKERNNGIPHADMEFNFPFEKAPEILKTLFDFCKTTRIPYYNFEMRATKKDAAMLSCCHSRDAFWIDFQAKSDHMSDFFGALEDLLAPFGYRKHWAKGMDHTSPTYLMKQYPRLTEFLDVIEDFDPKAKFRNEHLNLWFTKTKRASQAFNRLSSQYRVNGQDLLGGDLSDELKAMILADLEDLSDEED